MNLDNYISAWKQQYQKLPRHATLTEREIMTFIEQQSTGITASFRKGILVDFYLKSFLMLASFFLIFLFKEDLTVMGVNGLLASITGLLLFFQYKFYRDVAATENTTAGLREVLKTKIDYFNKEYIKAIYIAAVSNPLLVTAGLMYYFYFKYGRIRPLDPEDVVVLGTMILLSFFIAAFAHVKQYRFQIRQLERCLHDLDEDSLNELTVESVKRQRLRILIFAIIALVCGILVFLYLSRGWN
ncbi:hypothetical protein JXJ21_26270 [candidate division KSB1 bacterium]|nr:hypothetical protein [candidate division KSB1 bacterium]